MILFNGPNTPFGRMALATALELGVDVENRVIDVYSSQFLDGLNPLRQIPTLLPANGRAIADSRVICDYLGAMRPERRFVPRDDWDVLTRWSLVVGLMETSVARTMELRRPAAERSMTAVEKHDQRIARTIGWLEAEASELCSDIPRIDRLATAVVLEYMDFRSVRDWRADAPRLARWLEAETSRPCLAASRPREAQNAVSSR